jgi:hypothetical protein
MVALSKSTQEQLRTIFAPSFQDEVTLILVNECADNLPFLERAGPRQLDRIRLAVLRLSNGDVPKLREWVDRAKLDWRDVLMAAGVPQTDTAYHKWRPD